MKKTDTSQEKTEEKKTVRKNSVKHKQPLEKVSSAVKADGAKKKAVSGRTKSSPQTEKKPSAAVTAAKKKTGTRKKQADSQKTPAAEFSEKNDSALTENLPVPAEKQDKEAEIWLENKLSKMLPAKKESELEEMDEEEKERGDVPMSIVSHLAEFRRRIIFILGAFILFTAVSLSFSDYVIQFINHPFEETGLKLNMFKIMGGFFIRLKAAAFTGLLAVIPIVIYNIWKFAAPAMKLQTRKFSLSSIVAAICLFYLGVSFVFFFLIPFIIPIMTSFIPEDMMAMIGADDYLGFVMMFSAAMGVLFEMPIVVLVLTRIGLITPQLLVSKRKIAIVINFIIGGIVTPQDPFSMFLVAVPLIGLYEISILISKMMTKRMEKKEKEESEA